MPDIEVVPYNLPIGWTAPHLGMVMIQRTLDWREVHEGWALPEAVGRRGVALLESALRLAQEPAKQLILLPEYTLPSAQFAECASLVNRLLPENAVCMAGFDRMERQRWDEVRRGAKNGGLFDSAAAGGFAWVNTAVIWVRAGHSTPTYYLQPKLEPSDEERHRGMLRGRHVLCFKVGQWWLTQLVCYDFIAHRRGNRDAPLLLAILGELQAQGVGALDLLIVLQANPNPFNYAFVSNAANLVSANGFRTGAVVFANMAGQSEHSGFYLPYHRGWKRLERSKTPVDSAVPVFRLKQVEHHAAVYAGFREAGDAAHLVTFQSPLKVNPDPEDPQYLDVSVARATYDHRFGEPRWIPALEHHCFQAYREAHPDPVDLECRSQEVIGVLKQSYRSLAFPFRGGVTPERLREIIGTLLGDVGSAKDWEESTDKRKVVGRLIRALTVLQAGGLLLDLDLEDRRRTMPRNSFVTKPITAHAGTFTLDIVAGDPDRSSRRILCDYVSSRNMWLAARPGPHVCILLWAEDADAHLTPVDFQDLCRPMGRRPRLGHRDDRFNDPPGRRRCGQRTQFLKYYGRGIGSLVKAATSADELVRLVQEVFGWTAA